MHDELIKAIEDWAPVLQGEVGRQTPLITSGRIDSLGLFRLVMWIERKIGRPIDVANLEMAKEFDSIDAIVGFVVRERDRR
jgi:acyl carrier protein